nr:pentatricopeptide repeat-containing protein [Tanacetum cinerariifolium]
GLNDAARVGHNMDVDNVEDMNDVGNGVNIDEEVLASHISSNNKSDSEDNVDEYADMYSESDNDESHKSFDNLSKGKDKDTFFGVDKYADVDDNGIGLSPLVRQHEKYMEALLKKLKDKIKTNLQITIDAIVDLVMKKYKGIVSRTQCRNAKTFASNEGDATIQDHCGLHRRLFWAASKALYAQLFNKMMEKIRRANPRAHENLVNQEPKTWPRAFSNEGMCCEALKNGFSECFNYLLDSVTKRLKEA